MTEIENCSFYGPLTLGNVANNKCLFSMTFGPPEVVAENIHFNFTTRNPMVSNESVSSLR